ncbi:MAG TPA: hypothetical protein VIP77_19400 [Jiangellaceae bacterium]
MLQQKRDVAAARRADKLARLEAEAEHKRARADVAEAARAAELARAEREASRRADAEMARSRRETWHTGERTRVAAAMSQTGEARALRLERTRSLNMRVLVPVLLGFAAWSTTGVQHGAARLMGVDAGDPMWWALWLLEPVLIGAVVWVIIARARLATSGGRMAPGAEGIAAGCLSTSVVLNLLAAIPAGTPAGGWGVGAVAGVLGAMIAHAIGPVGAAATAYLIGVIDESITAADPWTESSGAPAPRLADLDLRVESTPAVSALESTHAAAIESAPESTPDSATVSAPESTPVAAQKRSQPRTKSAPKSAPRSTTESAPESAARALTDAQLHERMHELIAARELPANPSVRAVQSALGIGFDRAKRVRDLRVEIPGQLSVLGAIADVDRERAA